MKDLVYLSDVVTLNCVKIHVMDAECVSRYALMQSLNFQPEKLI